MCAWLAARVCVCGGGVPPTCAGAKEFVSMMPMVCVDAVAMLFLFDLTNPSTLLSVREWYRQVRGLNKARS